MIISSPSEEPFKFQITTNPRRRTFRAVNFAKKVTVLNRAPPTARKLHIAREKHVVKGVGKRLAVVKVAW